MHAVMKRNTVTFRQLHNLLYIWVKPKKGVLWVLDWAHNVQLQAHTHDCCSCFIDLVGGFCPHLVKSAQFVNPIGFCCDLNGTGILKPCAASFVSFFSRAFEAVPQAGAK